MGRFPDNLKFVVVPLSAATEAARRELTAAGPVVVACDVARFGQDKTVVMRRQGPVARIVWKIRGQDTMEIATYLKDYCDRNPVDYLVVDETGVGGGVVDRLRELRLGRTRLVPFIAGESAGQPEYFYNRTSEVWWIMRNRYISGDLDTDDDPALIAQVSTRTFSREPAGQIRLQSKYKMHSSPDEADALAMTFAVKRGKMQIWV